MKKEDKISELVKVLMVLKVAKTHKYKNHIINQYKILLTIVEQAEVNLIIFKVKIYSNYNNH